MKKLTLVIIFAVIVATTLVGCTTTRNAVKIASDKQIELLNKLLEAVAVLENSLIGELESDRRRFREINANIEARKAIDKKLLIVTSEIIDKINRAKTDKQLRPELLELKKEIKKVRSETLKSTAREETYKDIPVLIKLVEREYKSAINDTKVKFDRLKDSLELMREAHRQVNRFLNIEIKLEKEDVDKITKIIWKIGELEKEIK